MRSSPPLNSSSGEDTLAWTSFFSQFLEKVRTIYQLYLNQVDLKDSSNYFFVPDTFSLQKNFQEVSFDVKQLLDHYFSYFKESIALFESVTLSKPSPMRL